MDDGNSYHNQCQFCEESFRSRMAFDMHISLVIINNFEDQKWDGIAQFKKSQSLSIKRRQFSSS